MSEAEASSSKPTLLTSIVVTCLILGTLAFILLPVARSSDSASFVYFGITLATVAYMLTFINIRLGLALMILCIGLSPEVPVAGFSHIRLEDFLVPALLVAWWIRSLKTREEFAESELKRPFYVYLTVMVISTLIGIAVNSVEPQGSIMILGKNVIYILIFLLILNHIRTYNEFKAFVMLALLVSIASAFLSASTLAEQADDRVPERLHGPYGETANVFGGYLIMHITIFVGMFLYSPTTRGRVWSLLGAGSVAYFLLLTYSRTSWVALGVSLGLFGLLKQRRLLIILLICAILFPVIAPSSVLNRALTILALAEGPGPESWEARTDSWEQSVDRILGRPLLGSGLGSVPFGWVDNEYVRVALDLGLLGIGVFAWILIRIFLTANRTFNKIEGSTFTKGYMAGYLMALVAIVIHAWGATSFSTIRSMESFMVLTALMACAALRYDEWKKDEEIDMQLAMSRHGEHALRKHI